MVDPNAAKSVSIWANHNGNPLGYTVPVVRWTPSLPMSEYMVHASIQGILVIPSPRPVSVYRCLCVSVSLDGNSFGDVVPVVHRCAFMGLVSCS